MNLNIKKVLEKKSISVAVLERLTEQKGKRVSRVTIFQILDNKTSPKIETVQAIADALDVNLFDLFDSFVPAQMAPIYKKDEAGQFVEIGFLKE